MLQAKVNAEQGTNSVEFDRFLFWRALDYQPPLSIFYKRNARGILSSEQEIRNIQM